MAGWGERGVSICAYGSNNGCICGYDRGHHGPCECFWCYRDWSPGERPARLCPSRQSSPVTRALTATRAAVGVYRIDAKVMAEMVRMDAEQRVEIERLRACLRYIGNIVENSDFGDRRPVGGGE